MSTTTDNTTAPANHDNVLIVGKGFTVDGHVQGQGTLLVQGTVNGGIQASTVKLSESALVTGHIECAQLDIAGRLDGSFASENVVVRPSALVVAQQELSCSETCLVSGAISGSINARQLKVDKSGQINGKTTAAQLDIQGQVHGEVDASDMVVRSSGLVSGTVHYGNLSMERGSDVSGELKRKTTSQTHTPAKADEPVVIHLPVQIVQQLRKNPNDLQLSLADGAPLPHWISVDREHAWLVLGKKEYLQLQAQNQHITVRIQAGSENLVFKLPPEAQ